MALLNDRWEELRVEAMSRQTQLQQQLMRLQQGQLDQLADWLGQMENRIEKWGPIGQDLDTISSQVDSHKVHGYRHVYHIFRIKGIKDI